MSDYAIEGSAYERLQRENAALKAENAKLEAQYQELYDTAHNNSIVARNAYWKLKAERDLAVRVAWSLGHSFEGSPFPDVLPVGDGLVVLSDVRKVLVWYRELESEKSEKGSE